MTDPFESMFGADEPSTPRAAFAERLRTRLLTELADLIDDETGDAVTRETVSGETVSGETVSGSDGTGTTGTGPRNPGSLFYFTLPGADIERAARFYSELFGWELHQGDAGYHVANVYPPMGLASNDSTDPQVWIEVEDIEAAVVQIRELGGQAEDPVHYDSGWSASCIDPQGVHFNLSIPTEGYRQPARRSTETGELFYWSLPALAAADAKVFYSQVFGWEFGDPGNQGGMHVENKLPDGGLGGGREGTHPELFFRVADLDGAMAKVRELGGTAEPAGKGPEGRHAVCVDDQGVTFGISQPS